MALAVLLRGAKVLAYRLSSEELKRWIERELDGYARTDYENLPDYRVTQATNVGNFVGIGWSQLPHAPIALSSIPEEYREHLRHLELTESVAALEQNLGQGDTSETLRIPWPADLIATVGGEIYQGMTCLQAWKAVSRGTVKHALDSIRNRLLTFLLELEAAHPELRDSEEGLADIRPEETRGLVNTFIIGDHNVVASGSDIVQEFDQEVRAGDLSSLSDALRQLGVSDGEMDRLRDAIREDGQRIRKQGFGERVAAWTAKVAGKGASGALSGMAGATGGDIAKAVAAFYGWA